MITIKWATGPRVRIHPSGWSYSYTSNKLNQHTQISGTHASLPPTNTTLSYDPHGNLISRGTTQYQYDDHNRLTSIVIPTSLGANQWRTFFTYDGFDRRAEVVEQTWNAGTSSWDTDSATRYIYDGMDVVQERRSADNSIAVKYVRSGNIGGLLARIESAVGETPEKQLFYHYDGSGNVTQLTDSTESVVAAYDYDAYGNLLSSSGAEANQPYRFSTKWFHARSGLYDYGYRFYSAGMGRWINRDPIEEEGGANLQAAFANDPINNTDEYGEQSFVGSMPPWFGPAVGLGARPPVSLPRGGTYTLRNGLNRVVRSGRTNDLARRQGEHGRDPALARYRFRLDKRTDNRDAQRGREQMLHDKYRPPLNKIRPIDPKNPKYQRYMREGGKLSVVPGSIMPCPARRKGWWERFKDWWNAPPPPLPITYA